MVAFRDSQQLGADSLEGDVVCVISSLFYAIYTVVLKLKIDEDDRDRMLLIFGIFVFPLLRLRLENHQQRPPLSKDLWVSSTRSRCGSSSQSWMPLVWSRTSTPMAESLASSSSMALWAPSSPTSYGLAPFCSCHPWWPQLVSECFFLLAPTPPSDNHFRLVVDEPRCPIGGPVLGSQSLQCSVLCRLSLGDCWIHPGELSFGQRQNRAQR